MEGIQQNLPSDGLQFEYVVGKLLSDIASPMRLGMHEEQERGKASIVYSLARIIGLKDYKDEFDA